MHRPLAHISDPSISDLPSPNRIACLEGRSSRLKALNECDLHGAMQHARALSSPSGQSKWKGSSPRP